MGTQMINESILLCASCMFMGAGVGREEEVKWKDGEEMALEEMETTKICTWSVAVLSILFWKFTFIFISDNLFPNICILLELDFGLSKSYEI